MNVSSSQLIEIFRINKQELSRWHQKGCPKIERGRWNLKKVIAWWVLNVYEVRLEREGIDESLKTARQKYWKAKAEKEEINVSIIKGELIPKEKLSEVWGSRIIEVRQGLLNLADRLPPVLEGKSQREIKSVVRQEMKRLLDIYSRDGEYTPQLADGSKNK